MYLHPEPPEITRHFVNLGERQVHFRLGGSGPPLLLLHQSPTSSAEMVTELVEFADCFTVLAVDTPGFGQSDRLPVDRPDITVFAQALAEFLDALALDKVLLYGFHTGAIIGFEFARLFPDRCAAAVVNGLVVMEGTELEDFLQNYNVKPPPTAAGEHLAWTWARWRDQRIFFPWYRKEREARMAFDLPDANFQQPFTLDYFRSGDGGRAAYQAAFAYPTRARMPDIRSPVFLLNYAQDPLAPHPERLAGWPDTVQREIFEEPASLNARAKQRLIEHAPLAVELQRSSVGDFAGPLQKDIANTEAGPVFLRRSTETHEPALVILHDVGASSRPLETLVLDLDDRLSPRRQMICIDLPGHGDTGPMRLSDYGVESNARVIASAVKALNVDKYDVLAFGASCIVATELARAQPDAIQRLVLVDPWLMSADERRDLAGRYVPELEPHQNGQHFLSAWTFARDGELYWTWYECKLANALTRRPEIEPEQTHRRCVDVLMAAPALSGFIESALAYDFADALRTLRLPVFVFGRTGNGHEERAQAIARIAPAAIYNRLDESRSEWAAEISGVL